MTTSLRTVGVGIIAVLVPALGTAPARGQDVGKSPAGSSAANPTAANTPAAVSADAPKKDSGSSKPAPPAHVALLKGAKSVTGLIPAHHKATRMFLELNSGHYGSEYIVLISISRGIGTGYLLGGMPSGFGDDWVWTFRKIGEKVHIVRKNVRFRAKKGTPEYSAVSRAYSDSVLFSLPILGKGPQGGDLVDVSRVFLSDLPQLADQLPGFMFASDKSTFGPIKGFSGNLELEVAATYASSGRLELDYVPDSRGLTVHVHYSISKVPSTGYQPRQADDRVGYFLSVVKDHSKSGERNQFVRYITRWDIRKADSSAPMSPPKKPLVFWVENTVPFKYRKPIRDGILEWNKAFAKAGFIDAIEVRQQPDTADWDPEDINYNTFRWIPTSDSFSAIGPSRVNPYTGQILDADILFAADSLQYWRDEFDTMTAETAAAMTGGPLDRVREGKPGTVGPFATRFRPGRLGRPVCRRSRGLMSQLALATAAVVVRADPKQAAELKEKMIMQGLKETAMHEVGHTLGLRHNFKASTFLSLEDINNPGKTRESGMVGSVMDYNPANIAAPGKDQGDFFTTTLGPYDVWAIEYGYKPLSGGTDGEKKELLKIAARCNEPGLSFATDEDTGGLNPDPHANQFDLGNDPVAFARQRAALADELVPGLVDRLTKEGDDYVQARRAFNVLVANRVQAAFFVARHVGGLVISRNHKGDANGKPPVTVLDPKKQREALDFVAEQVLGEKPYEVPPTLYNHLAASHWNHWGTSGGLQPDFPVHYFVSIWQNRVLSQLLSSVTLTRIHDTELKVPADEDAFTAAELIVKLTAKVFAELDNLKAGDFTVRKPAIGSLRRNLQRTYLRRLGNLALGKSLAPDDCQTIAYAELTGLRKKINGVLAGKAKLDSYSRAHLLETGNRIDQILEARISVGGP